MIHNEKELEVRWVDCDANRHVRHSAYYDYGAHIRTRIFAENGFDAKKMISLNIGAILFKEECSFLKEIRLEDTIRINVLRGEIPQDAAQWVLHHEIFNQKGQKCAHISVKGAWMDMAARKLTAPPAGMADLLLTLPKGEYFEYKKSNT